MNKPDFNYRTCLLDVLSTQKATYRELYVYCINLVLPDELNDFRELLEEGDEVPTDIEILRALENPVVKILIPVFDRLERDAETLINVNAFTEKELQYSEEEGVEDYYVTEVTEDSDPNQDFWIQELLTFINYAAFSFFLTAYELSHGPEEPGKEILDRCYFPDRDAAELLNMDDFNVALIAEFAFSLTDLGMKLDEYFL